MFIFSRCKNRACVSQPPNTGHSLGKEEWESFGCHYNGGGGKGFNHVKEGGTSSFRVVLPLEGGCNNF